MAELFGNVSFEEVRKKLENSLFKELEEYAADKKCLNTGEYIGLAIAKILNGDRYWCGGNIINAISEKSLHENVLFIDLIWIIYNLFANEAIFVKKEKTQNSNSFKLNVPSLKKKPNSFKICRVARMKIDVTKGSKEWKACHSNSFNLLSPRKFMKIERIEPLAFQARKRTQNLLKNKNIWIEENEWKKLTEYERVICRFNFSIGHQWVDPIYWSKFSRDERNKFKRRRKLWWNKEKEKWSSKQIAIANYWRRRVKFNGLVFILIKGGFFIDFNAKEFKNADEERKKYIKNEFKDFTYYNTQAKDEVKKISIEAYNRFILEDNLMKKKDKISEGLSGIETGHSSSVMMNRLMRPNLERSKKWKNEQIQESWNSGDSAGYDGDNLSGRDRMKCKNKKVNLKQNFEEKSDDLENYYCDV